MARKAAVKALFRCRNPLSVGDKNVLDVIKLQTSYVFVLP